MPNKRDPNKAYIGVFIDKNDKKRLQTMLAEDGMTLTEFFYYSILNYIEEKQDEIKRKLKEADGRTVEGKIKRNGRNGK